MSSQFYRRYRLIVLFPFALIFAVVLFGSIRAVQNNSTKVSEWLPKDNRATEEFTWFRENFAGDDLLLVSWEGCTVDDSRLAAYASELRRDVRIDDKNVTLFRKVISAAEVLEALCTELSREDALKRLEGWLVGPVPAEGLPTGCLVLLVTYEGFGHRHFMAQHIRDCANRVTGLSAEKIHVAGPTIDSVYIDRASGDSIILLSALCYLVCFVVMLICFRSVLLAGAVFATAIFNQQLSLALIHYSGWQVDCVLLIIPPLVLVLTTAAGVHLANYYRDAVREEGIEGATMRAVKFGWGPCLMAATTTGFGLFSLVISDLVPIARFGCFSTLGLLAGTGVLFLLLPSLIEQMPPKKWARRFVDRGESSLIERAWQRLTAATQRYCLPILGATAVLLILGATGLPRIHTSVRVHEMFYEDTKLIQDYHWMEKHVGPLIPIEVVVRIPPVSAEEKGPKNYPMLDRLRLVGQIESAIRDVKSVDATVSAVKIAPALPTPYVEGERPGLQVMIQRRGFERGLVQSKEAFAAAGWLRETDEEQLWRISARVRSTDASIDYAHLIEDLKITTDEVIGRQTKPHFRNIEVVFSGGVPLIDQAQKQLLKDLVKSFLLAFAFITAAMIFWLRSFTTGLLTMIPNVLPFIVVFGILGWWQVDVDIGSMLTAATAMGIAVDDTFHFVTCYQRGMLKGMDRYEAVHFAFRKTGRAMIQTTLICGLGLLVYTLSPFVPTVRFAWLMFIMLAMALVGDLIVLPALLISPLAPLPKAAALSREVSKSREAVADGSHSV